MLEPTPFADQPFLTWAFPGTTIGGATPISRTMPDRIVDIFNVKEFGTFDTSAHTRQAIQAAVTAAATNTGGIVFFPPGNYVIDQAIVVPQGSNGLRFVGCGGAADAATGSCIQGSFPDYLIRTIGSPNQANYLTASFEYLALRQNGSFVINNTVPAAYGVVLAWNSGTTYTLTWPEKPWSQVYGSDGIYYGALLPRMTISTTTNSPLNPGTYRITVTTALPFGLTTGTQVSIFNVNGPGTGNNGANGVWTITNIISSTVFDVNATYVSDGTSGTAAITQNLNHDPTNVSNQGVWWTFHLTNPASPAINRNSQVAGGCVFTDSTFCRFLRCSLIVNSGIGICAQQSGILVENCGINGPWNNSANPRTQTIGVLFCNGRVTGARIQNLGIGILTFGSGCLPLIDNMTNENDGYGVFSGNSPINYFGLNEGGYFNAGNAGMSFNAYKMSCESCMSGYYIAAGGATLIDCTADGFGGAGLIVSDVGLKAGGGLYQGVRVTGSWSSAAFDLSGSSAAYFNQCLANNSMGTQVILPLNTFGAPIVVDNSPGFTGGLSFVALTTTNPPAYAIGQRARCSDATVAFSNTTVGTTLLAGGGTHDIAVVWDGAKWIITGP